MRTTLDLPQALLEEAQEALQFKSKTDVVIASLRELVRRRRIEELKSMYGQLEIDVDLVKSRRRGTRRRK
jgi:Arc/MetJ family transcription regulator